MNKNNATVTIPFTEYEFLENRSKKYSEIINETPKIRIEVFHYSGVRKTDVYSLNVKNSVDTPEIIEKVSEVRDIVLSKIKLVEKHQADSAKLELIPKWVRRIFIP